MNLNASITSIRGGSVSADFSVGRGSPVGSPKKSFGQRLGGADKSGALASLETVNQRMRTAASIPELCDLVDEYVLTAARLAQSFPSFPAAPAGRILTVAIKALNG